MSEKISKSASDWQSQLTPEQYHICRECGTEPAFTGQYWDCHDAGTYLCACCGQPLFSSTTKYDSGSGWPSYWQPINKTSISRRMDFKFGMRRVEILCSRCDAHLGHVFEDGPAPTGLRYCINSASLKLQPAQAD